MIDIGVNLTDRRFELDIDQVISDAHAAGIHKMIITGTSIKESENALKLTGKNPLSLFATAGVHPHNAKEYTQNTQTQLYQLSKNDQIVAIGECGLDFNRNFSTKKEQEIAFISQIELAIDRKLPLFLHERDASERLVQLLKPFSSELPKVVIHCFTGSTTDLQRYLDMDFYIGITGWLCDPLRGETLRKNIALIPDNRIMIETDAPYLIPKSVKSKLRPKPKKNRNEPQYLRYILNEIAISRKQLPIDLERHSSLNACSFFSI